MSAADVVLALDTALDIAAVRRLHDYADLDDAGVTRAFEQMRMQRLGHLRLPAYLLAIRQVVAIVDDGGDIRVVDIDGSGDEAAMLDRLEQQLSTAAGTLVLWDTQDMELLGMRAFMHDRPLRLSTRHSRVFELAESLAVDAEHPSTDTERDIITLTGLPAVDSAASPGARLRAIACNRYRLWLRWQTCRGELTAGERAARERALARPHTPEPA
ncbi:hypothetical protein [Salinisphaera aquimarina]|uniref:Uncharacterized protein n=1 Tax=Salinisphaera aquimarina TaxID=2094031 RepID=A0ABV7ESA5_9GAMM